jgi:exosortase N
MSSEILVNSVPFRQISLPQVVLILTTIAGIGILAPYLSQSLTSLFMGVLASGTMLRQVDVKKTLFPGWLVLLPMLLCLMIPVQTFLYFSLVLLFIYWFGKKGYHLAFLGWASLIISSPVFSYAATVFSFPIRLQLAEWVGSLFALGRSQVSTKGNSIFFGGQEFSVDPACMGLHMLSVSMLLGIALIGLLHRAANRKLSFSRSFLFLVFLFMLNILANLVRIVVLVQFALLPGTTGHELAGLFCLLVYVLIPSGILARRLVDSSPSYTVSESVRTNVSYGYFYLLVILFFVTALRLCTADTYAGFTSKSLIKLPGYTTRQFAPGILKIENQKSLLYIKFIRGFYDTEHNPSICWKGSGYDFKEIRKVRVGANEIFTALLDNGNEQLHTAWWYGNGAKAGIDQWAWRWDMLKGSIPYAVINITTNTEEDLRKELKLVLGQKLLNPLFKVDK